MCGTGKFVHLPNIGIFFLSSFEGNTRFRLPWIENYIVKKKTSHCSSLESSLWFYKMTCNEVRHSTTSSSWGRKSFKTWSIWNIWFVHRIFGLIFVPELLDSTETQIHWYVYRYQPLETPFLSIWPYQIWLKTFPRHC